MPDPSRLTPGSPFNARIGALWLVVISSLLVFGCGCNRRSSDPRRIKVVSSLPLTGSARLQTEMMERAIRMAFEEVDYRCGAFVLEYQSWDDATAQAGTWDPAKEKENASRAAADSDVMVYIGTYNSGAAKIAIPILNQSGLVMISPGNTYTGLTKPSGEKGEPEIYYPSGQRNYCRVVPADDLQGAAGAAWAAQLGMRTVYILDDKELYGKGIAAVFESECQRLGLQVLGHQGIDGKASDFRAVTSKIAASKAELVYFGGTIQNGAARLLKDLRESHPAVAFMGPDSLKDTAFLQGAGSSAEGAMCTLGSLPAEHMNEAGKAWYRLYRERYGVEPEAFAIYGYEAARVALAGIARAGVKDREAIRKAVMGTRDFPGAMGSWSFDSRGDTTLTAMSGFQVKDGQFVFARRLDVSAAQTPTLTATERDVQERSWTALLQQLFTGLSNGALIAVIALGYTLVYGIVEMVNFAHGEVFMMGAFMSLTLVGALGLSAGTAPWLLLAGLALVLVASMLFSGLLNAAIDRLAYRRLRDSNKQVPMIAAMGVSFILLNVGGYWKGWGPLDFPSLLPSGNLLESSSFRMTFAQLFVVLVTVPLLLGLYGFVYHTRLGKAMRAVAQNPDAARLMGVDTDRTITSAFFLGGCLAGAAGFLYGLYNHEVFFLVGFRQGLNAFTAAVLGGIGSLPGAVLGGLAIGLVEALTSYYAGQALAPAAVFMVLILVICLRPSGLLGRHPDSKV
jgi:branched-chain amino acid transport system substrate-binding protein